MCNTRVSGLEYEDDDNDENDGETVLTTTAHATEGQPPFFPEQAHGQPAVRPNVSH